MSSKRSVVNTPLYRGRIPSLDNRNPFLMRSVSKLARPSVSAFNNAARAYSTGTPGAPVFCDKNTKLICQGFTGKQVNISALLMESVGVY